MLTELTLGLDELGTEDGWLCGFDVQWEAHTLRLEIGGAWHFNPTEMDKFDVSRGPTALRAVINFLGVTSVLVGWDAFISNLGEQGGMVRVLEEFPLANFQPPPVREGSYWRSGEVTYGTNWNQHVLSNDLEVIPRAFALRTSGLNAQWIATSVVAVLSGPPAER